MYAISYYNIVLLVLRCLISHYKVIKPRGLCFPSLNMKVFNMFSYDKPLLF